MKTPKFQKRHHEAIARVLAGHARSLVLASVTMRLAEMFKRDNPNFDLTVFLAACLNDEADNES